MPKISVIVPCYNGGEFLPETIDSVLAQTYSDWEIILVDDASDDGTTPAVIAEQATRDGRIRVITHSKNKGLAGTRNTGIAGAEGTYILPLDADDIIAPTYLEKAVLLIEKADLVYVHYQCFGKMEHTVKITSDQKKIKDKMPFRNSFSATSLFKKADWEAFGGFDEELRSQEDWDFWLNFAEADKNLALLDEVLFFYRTHENSLFNKTIKNRKNTFKRIKQNHPNIYNWKNYYFTWNYLRYVVRRALFQVRLRKGRRVVRIFGIYLIKPT